MAPQLAVYDLTLSRMLDETKDSTARDIISELSTLAKRWAFQGELSAPTANNPGGYKHWQIRVSLFKKMRVSEMFGILKRYKLLRFAHPSPSTRDTALGFNGKENEALYVMKMDTRIDGEGPFTDKTDRPVFIQDEVQEIINAGLRPWQQTIVDSKEVKDSRCINIIIDAVGGIGKSSIAGYMEAKRLAIVVEPQENYKDYMAAVLAQEKLGMYMFDLPRAMPKRNLNSLFSAIETIKDGKAYDGRYKYRKEIFARPVIWVFSNVPPPMECLSVDRWKIWTVDKKTMNLVPYHQVVATPTYYGGNEAGFLSRESMLLDDSGRASKRSRFE